MDPLVFVIPESDQILLSFFLGSHLLSYFNQILSSNEATLSYKRVCLMKVRRMFSCIFLQRHKCSWRNPLKHLSFLFPSLFLTVSFSALWSKTNQNIISYFFHQRNIAIATDKVSLDFI